MEITLKGDKKFDDIPSIKTKALRINLNEHIYGTFAEIGAGQEVVRWFFQAGGAAGTVSKSISAYDMQVSDELYGTCSRYVCRERLEAMLDKEQTLNQDVLGLHRGKDSCFFTFADTVSARNYTGTNECHGWLGIRFQSRAQSPDSTIVIHVRMLDSDNAAQQEALGIVGVNLVYAAFFLYADPVALIASLLDNLTTDRLEIDMIEFTGAEFEHLDNRVMSLHLVQQGLTGAAMFAADGTVLQPSEALRKRPLLIERGRFRPVTHVNIDMLTSGLREFETITNLQRGETLPILEVTMSNLADDTGAICLDDFVSRVEVLETTGHTVMVSDFFEYYRLADYLFRYTDRPVGIALGVSALKNLFDERFYTNVEGGILQSFGRLFTEQLNLLVYPWKDQQTGVIESLHKLELDSGLAHLFAYLRARRSIMPIEDITHAYLDIHSHEVLEMIRNGDPGWTNMVPEPAARAIVQRGLFGYGTQSRTLSLGT